MICNECSAEAHVSYTCARCALTEHFCERHKSLASAQIHMCDPQEKVNRQRRQIYSRGDFALDMQIVGEQGERRYFLCGPDDAMSSGVTLANLEAVWHLLGEAIVMEKKSK